MGVKSRSPANIRPVAAGVASPVGVAGCRTAWDRHRALDRRIVRCRAVTCLTIANQSLAEARSERQAISLLDFTRPCGPTRCERARLAGGVVACVGSIADSRGRRAADHRPRVARAGESSDPGASTGCSRGFHRLRGVDHPHHVGNQEGPEQRLDRADAVGRRKRGDDRIGPSGLHVHLQTDANLTQLREIALEQVAHATGSGTSSAERFLDHEGATSRRLIRRSRPATRSPALRAGFDPAGSTTDPAARPLQKRSSTCQDSARSFDKAQEVQLKPARSGSLPSILARFQPRSTVA